MNPGSLRLVQSVVLMDELDDNCVYVCPRHFVLPSFGSNIYLTDISVLNGTDFRLLGFFN